MGAGRETSFVETHVSAVDNFIGGETKKGVCIMGVSG